VSFATVTLCVASQRVFVVVVVVVVVVYFVIDSVRKLLDTSSYMRLTTSCSSEHQAVKTYEGVEV
jgi:uncharacterized protein HemY